MVMGAPRGKQQRGRLAKYDPTSDRDYMPGPRFKGDDAVKLVRAANAIPMSTSELLNELVRRMDVDESGRPLWWVAEHPDGFTEELPLTGTDC